MKSAVLISIIALVLGGVYFAYQKTFAVDAPVDLNGWAWSSNIGWISLTCDHSNDGTAAPNNVNTCASNSDYKVSLDPATAQFSGYAWSSNGLDGNGGNIGIGWIKFNPAGPYPASPNYSARLVAVTTDTGVARYQVQGWIRACAGASNPGNCFGGTGGNTGGWDGWIKMSGNTTNCPPMANPSSGLYETCLSSDGRSLSGWAWGNENVGWINFDPALNAFNRILGTSGVQIKEIKPR